MGTIRHDLSIIRERTDTMKTLTEELFRYSVLTSADKELHPEPLSLNAALEVSLAAFYGTLTEKDITPQISMPDTPVVRTLDAEAVRRIFDNILSNAVKYSDGDLVVALSQDGNIRFSNTAKSLAAVEVERLFDRYYTVETGRRSTGLGLAIAKHLTEEMGGKIFAEYADSKLRVRVSFA